MSATNKCGTRAGWNAHMRAKTPACDDCNRASTLYQREYRRVTGTGRKFTFPVEAPRFDLGLGAALARGFRESA